HAHFLIGVIPPDAQPARLDAFHRRRGPMADKDNKRDLEQGIQKDLAARITYAGYLQLDTLLSAKRPVSSPEYHDEMLFIIQHHVAELWLKLMYHELAGTMRALDGDDVGMAMKMLARIKQIQHQL